MLIIVRKRFKHSAPDLIEPIMLKFIDLCVPAGRKYDLRSQLIVYRNAVQQSAPKSLETVINYLIAKAEERLASATSQAETEMAALPTAQDQDDELPLQPATLMNDTFLDTDNVGNRERIERRLVVPAVRFVMDAFDTALDITKTNDRLEQVYLNIAQRAFEFCKTHNRKTDFRRVCESRLRKDLSTVMKYGTQQGHGLNLADPDTLARQLDIRFLQLETAVQLELWQEAFRTVEDIHSLITQRKSTRPAMMATYYEKLTEIFRAEGGKQTAVFHAAAWARYYHFAERAGSVSDKAAGCVLLSALAIPLGEVESKMRLITLLNLPQMPTREALVADAVTKHLKRVPSVLRQLYDLLEIDFQPLKSSKLLAPVITSLPSEYRSYLPALRDVFLSRLFVQLGDIYDAVSLSHILTLVKPLDETPWAIDASSLEQLLMTAARERNLPATVDHVAKTISFTAPPADSKHLSSLAICLHTAVSYLHPSTATRADIYASTIAADEEERKAAAVRRQIVIKRRELMDEANIRRDREEASLKAERSRLLAEETARAQREQTKQLERDRLQREMDATRRVEAEKLAQSLAAKGGLKIDISNIEDLDSSKLVAMQVEQLAKEKREHTDKLRIVARKVDHLERALRKEERPLLAADYEIQKEQDRKDWEAANTAAKKTALAQQKHDVALKSRLARMIPDYLVARQSIESQREVELRVAKEKAEARIREEKDKLRQKVLARRAAEREQREAEEREREEEERRIQGESGDCQRSRLIHAEEEEQREAAEAKRAADEAEAAAEAEARKTEEAAKLAAARAEREEQRRKDEELRQLREAREREAEEKRNALKRPSIPIRREAPPSTTVPSPSLAPTTVKAGGWRDRVASKAADGVTSTASPTPSPAPASPVPRLNGSPANGTVNGEATPSVAGPDGEANDKWRPSTRGNWRGRGGGSTPPTSGSSRGGSRLDSARR